MRILNNWWFCVFLPLKNLRQKITAIGVYFSKSCPTTRASELFSQLDDAILRQRNSPLKQEEVDIIVALGEEVSQNAGGISAADLIGWQAKVDALDKIPHLSHYVLAETPTRGRRERQWVQLKDDTTVPVFLSLADAFSWLQSSRSLHNQPFQIKDKDGEIGPNNPELNFKTRDESNTFNLQQETEHFQGPSALSRILIWFKSPYKW